MKNKVQLTIILLIALILIAGVVFFMKRDTAVLNTLAGNEVVNGGVNATTTQQTHDVQKITISKDSFGNVADRDLELAVGDTYGKFKISRITDTASGPNRVYFSGEETIKGKVQFNGFFGGVYFTADKDELEKIPQIFKEIYNEPVYIDGLIVNGSSKITREDFTFNESGELNTMSAEIKFTNLMLIVPPIEGFGSANAVEVTIIK